MALGRPRTVSDGQVFLALEKAIGKVGPADLTLADVAREANVTPAALIQRFGSKRALYLAFIGTNLASLVETMHAAYKGADDPVEGLMLACDSLTGPAMPPGEFANHLAFLHFELADVEFRALLAEFDAAVVAEITSYIDDAIEKGRLATDDIPALADAINNLRNGTKVAWAVTPKGALVETMRRNLETLLQPYVRSA